ncbi:tetratricopeptide repeat protein [Photobacterium chitinilyticum]|uniref:Uncharacterized protein n=1 Tax=Photobacterium chitinilyticum TaxID=2485123 RepID=A0A444JSX4_9GAMM|nr:tetratricopeptide repeat protein [Photobacterium chitinilyticum]RWX56204.1 hypothetical protein EDI28_07940 [Photobacterium chitinilyticum]
MKIFSQLIAVFIITIISPESYASVTVSKPSITVDFSRQPLLKREATFSDSEARLLAKVQPLLEKQQYAKTLKQLKTSQPKESSAAYDFLLGQLAFSLKQPGTAETYFLSALKKQPDFVRAHDNLGILYLQNNQYQKAKRHLTQSISLGGANGRLYGYLGYIHLQSENYQGATAAYQQAALLEPEDTSWQQGLLQSYVASGAHSQAKSMLQPMLEKTPNDAQLWLLRANIALSEDSVVESISSLEVAYRLGKRKATAWQLADLYLQQKQFSLASHYYLSQPSEIAKNYQRLDRAIQYLLNIDELDTAKKLIAAASKQHPKLSTNASGKLYTRVGQLALRQGQLTTATTNLNKALKRSPVNGEALLALATVKTEQGNNNDAELLLIRAAGINQSRLQALQQYAQLSLDQNRYGKALSLLEQAKQLAPENQRQLDQHIKVVERLVNR